jgi:hypothetical protein
MATETLPIGSIEKPRNVLMVFLVGSFGGIAPTLLRIGVDLCQQNKSLKEVNASVLLGMAIFAFMGGVLAAIWDEVDLKKVFYIGLGLPSLITVATTTATTPQQRAELLPKASALISRSTTSSLFRTVADGNKRLKIVLPPEVAYDGAVAIFHSQDNSTTAVALRVGQEIVIPDHALTMLVTSPSAESERISVSSLPPNSLSVMKFTAQKDALFGLKYAVGAHSKPFKLSVFSTGTANVLFRGRSRA